MAMDGDTAILMFRGTNPTEIGDWFFNWNNSSHPSTHGKVHAGFWRSYETLHDQVVEVLRRKQPKRVSITAVVSVARLPSYAVTG